MSKKQVAKHGQRLSALFPDTFFVSMAVTIAFGLGFATILTMVQTVVLCATLFGIKT